MQIVYCKIVLYTDFILLHIKNIAGNNCYETENKMNEEYANSPRITMFRNIEV